MARKETLECRLGSAFKPVSSSRNKNGAASWLLLDYHLLARCDFSTPPSESHIIKLERFVENFFNKEFEPKCDLKTRKLSRKSCNPCKRLPLPQRASKKMIFSECQSETLENNFKFKQYLSPTSRIWLANLLGLTKQQVVTWFQNRRAKERKRAGIKLPRHGRKCIVSRQNETNWENAKNYTVVFSVNDCAAP